MPKLRRLSYSNLPPAILEIIFSYLDLRNTCNCRLVCRNWNGPFTHENSRAWRRVFHKLIPSNSIDKNLLKNVATWKHKLRAYFYGWNPLDCSRNIFIKRSGFTLHRNPIAQSTDAARGKQGVIEGRHCWEIWWEGPLGTVASIGIATATAPLHSPGYVTLLGSNSQSWGWNIVDNYLVHNGQLCGSYPDLPNAPKYQVKERIRLLIDCEHRSLAFENGFQFLGMAFKNLPKQTRFFPAISAVYGNTEVSMVYLGPPLDG